MLIIGDVHGKIVQYNNLISKSDTSIQVGDFGFKKQHDWHINHIDPSKHKINFGNHDYYPYLNMEHSTSNWSYIEDYIFTVRGADSIDKYLRTEGLDWFRNEELTYKEGYQIIENYEKIKPNIVVTHDCPQSVAENLFSYIHGNKSMTRLILQEMFEVHQPSQWFFGHHHKDIDVMIEGTNFICLDELSIYNL